MKAYTNFPPPTYTRQELLMIEPVGSRVEEKSFVDLFENYILTYVVLRKQAHPVFGIVNFLGIAPINDEFRESRRYKMGTVSDDGRIQREFDANGGYALPKDVDRLVREMDEKVKRDLIKMQNRIKEEMFEELFEEPTVVKGSAKPKKPLTDEELVTLFGEDEKLPTKKADRKKKNSKKSNKKKPNAGKTPNAIRKTKKPTKL
ncbi:Oidioi.mRNA.OKI2018_I69.XSR.g16324.t1.cds [Oikopleura dioica]|uniref:Oidioi.mRNA.OKI2018_I69.XSR.g16324.t1.cds n=1 Tax=Oikopleura dioica TaxID=34765 RepID=A0ABN7SKL9_OIKDI|nr:Oidioi.mRNA.OKI2018_I69.XSR.g16324.t1.cds [Oikopleura dioica]